MIFHVKKIQLKLIKLNGIANNQISKQNFGSITAEVFIQESENQDRNKFENCKNKNPL